jgi:ethanolamine utilization protein EutP (predicted NTPase)
VKKTFLVLLMLLLSGLLTGTVAAADADDQTGYYCPYMQQGANLTDEQKQQIATWQSQLIDNRSQMLKKQVEWGWITQAQADQQISNMQQWQKNGYGMWMMRSGGAGMMGPGGTGMMGPGGSGMMGSRHQGYGMMWGGEGYYSPYAQKASNLTDEQKTQIAKWQDQMIDNRKQVLKKQVEWGWITQAQADRQIEIMQQWQKNGSGMWMMGPGR